MSIGYDCYRTKLRRKGGKEMLKVVMSGGTYRNKKTGNHYYVLAQGRHTEPPNEDMVIYVRRDGDDKTVWIRPTELFKEKFEV